MASEVKALVCRGDLAAARESFADLVAHHQRRASRIAYQYLRDAADADEAVQDAFVKVFEHITSFREDQPFDGWFTRILINSCLDRLKARSRRQRWFVPADAEEFQRAEGLEDGRPSPEAALIGRERRARLAAAVSRLPGRQRLVLTLCHFDGWSPREVSQLTGLGESTVRVHLFRGLRRLRRLLEDADGLR